jgi:DNA-binding XRE family transcriptional regulator
MEDNPDKNLFLSLPVKECIEKEHYTPLDVIKILLRERALKQTELAEKIGLSRQALNNYIRGHWTIPTAIKIKIAQALNVDSSVIWDLEEKK